MLQLSLVAAEANRNDFRIKDVRLGVCYNLAKRHTSVRMTPAMAAGLADHIWEIDEIIELSDK